MIVVFFYLIVNHYKMKDREQEKSTQQAVQKKISDEELLSQAVGYMTQAEALRQAKIMCDDRTISEIQNNTYQGPWPESRSDGGYLSIYDDLRILNVAGMNFRKNMGPYRGFIDAALVPEPKNEFDPNAIKIVAVDGHHLGYIPAVQTDFVRSLTGESFPYHCKCEVIEGRDDDDEKTYHGFVYIKRKDKGE